MGRRRSRITKAEAKAIAAIAVALAPAVAVAAVCAACAAPLYFLAEWSLVCTVQVALILIGGIVAGVVGHLSPAEQPRLAQFSAAMLRRPVLVLPVLAVRIYLRGCGPEDSLTGDAEDCDKAAAIYRQGLMGEPDVEKAESLKDRASQIRVEEMRRAVEDPRVNRHRDL